MTDGSKEISWHAGGPDLRPRTVGYNARTKGCDRSGLAKTWRETTSMRYSPRHGSHRPEPRRDWAEVERTGVLTRAPGACHTCTIVRGPAPGSGPIASGFRAFG